MDFCCCDNSAFLFTLLTKRVLTDVAVANPFPGTAILLVDVRGAFVVVVLASGDGGMIFTILSVRQFGASGIGTWSLGFTWHFFSPSSAFA